MHLLYKNCKEYEILETHFGLYKYCRLIAKFPTGKGK